MPVSPALAFAVARLQTRNRKRRLDCPALVLPTDSERLANPVAAVLRLPRLWARGSPPLAVIVREPDRGKRAVLAAALAPLCRARRIRLLVANDPSLAARVRADGVHFSEAALRRRKIGCGAFRRGPRGFVTAAAHSSSALVRAARLGLDAALLSPVFATRSHPDARPLGTLQFAALCYGLRRRAQGSRRRGPRMAVIALGGITGAAASRLRSAGADGLAAIGALS